MINRLLPEDDPELAAWDMLAAMTREAEKNLDHSLALELEGLAGHARLAGGKAQGSPVSWGTESLCQGRRLSNKPCATNAAKHGWIQHRAAPTLRRTSALVTEWSEPIPAPPVMLSEKSRYHWPVRDSPPARTTAQSDSRWSSVATIPTWP